MVMSRNTKFAIKIFGVCELVAAFIVIVASIADNNKSFQNYYTTFTNYIRAVGGLSIVAGVAQFIIPDFYRHRGIVACTIILQLAVLSLATFTEVECIGILRGRASVVPYNERVSENTEDYVDNTEDQIDRSNYENIEDYYREKTRRINEYYKRKYAGKNTDWHEPPGDITDRSNYNNLEDYYRAKYRKINNYYKDKYAKKYDYLPKSGYTKHEGKNDSKSKERAYHSLFTALFAGDIIITLACVILLIPHLRKMNITEGEVNRLIVTKDVERVLGCTTKVNDDSNQITGKRSHRNYNATKQNDVHEISDSLYFPASFEDSPPPYTEFSSLANAQNTTSVQPTAPLMEPDLPSKPKY